MTATVIDAFEQATSESDVSTLSGQSIYLFGRYNASRERLLKLDYRAALNKTKVGNQSYPSISAGTYALDSWETSEFPVVNGMANYWMYGKAAHTVEDTTHTVTNFVPATNYVKPRIKIAKQLGTANLLVGHGCLVTKLNYNWVAGEFLHAQMSGIGCKFECPDYTLETPTYPGSKSNPYSFSYCKYGTDASEVAFAVDAINIAIAYMEEPRGVMGDDGYYEMVEGENGPVLTLVTLAVREEKAELFDNAFASTAKSLLCQWINKDGYTITLDSNGNTSYFHGVTAVADRGEILGYTANFTLQNPNWINNDHLVDEFYTIPT